MCTHTALIELLGSEFGEPYKSVQRVFENGVHCRLFSTAWCTSVSSLGVVHLLYKVLRDLPVWYRLYTHSLSAQFGSEFGKPYESLQEVYENGVHCRLLSTAW